MLHFLLATVLAPAPAFATSNGSAAVWNSPAQLNEDTAGSIADPLLSRFDQYMVAFGKTYASAAEEKIKFENFRVSLERIAAGNADRAIRGADQTQGLTKFSDLSREEFRAQYLTLTPPAATSSTLPMLPKSACAAARLFPKNCEGALAVAGTADGFDWITKGAVTPVKDQGQCGGCWAFGTTGDIEGTAFLKTGKLISLSEQSLISCGRDAIDEGCDGGLQSDAFVYVEKHGLPTEASYKFSSGPSGKSGACNATAAATAPLTTIASWSQVSNTAKGEADLKDALTKNGPLTIGIDAQPMFDYKSGIDFPKNCHWTADHGCGCDKASLNHAVLIVGYGTGQLENGEAIQYWKIKNSWGKDWGEDGYYRVVAGHNMCGLALDVTHSVPEVSLVV